MEESYQNVQAGPANDANQLASMFVQNQAKLLHSINEIVKEMGNLIMPEEERNKVKNEVKDRV